MCGIAGCFGGNERPVIEWMLEKMKMRGPDDRGIHESGPVVLGHNRLSIIDVDGGHQPLSNEKRTVWLAYNGETYNYRQLREHLKPRHRFVTRTDSEVLIHLYEEYGPSMVSRLDGMFAFALWDSERGRLLMARDPLGIKPLYYGLDDAGRLWFASEIKAIAPVVGNVRELPAGHYYDSISGKTLPYFRYPEESGTINDIDAAARGIIERLSRAVEKRLMSDVPLGVFLSGGLDSSMISALAARRIPKINSFAVGVEGSKDVLAARRVARYIGSEHHEYIFGEKEVLELLPEVIYHLESYDPSLVRSSIPTFLVAKMAATKVKVVLSGEGADELFAGYHYLRSYSRDVLRKELRNITLALHNTNLQRVDRLTMAHALEARVPFLDIELLRYANRIGDDLKVRKGEGKWILRYAAEGLLPEDIIWRNKEKFAVGTGVNAILKKEAERKVSDSEFKKSKAKTKEEVLYRRIFSEYYPEERVLETMGRSRSLDPNQVVA